MTVSNTESSITYQGNGVTTVFPYMFRIDSTDDTRVVLYDSITFAETDIDVADYSISGLGSDLGGNVTYNPLGVPIPATKYLTVKRVIEYTQDLNLTNQSAYIPTALESQLDRLVYMIQQLDAEVALTLQLPAGGAISVADILAAAATTSANASAAAASQVAAAASAAAAAISAGSLTAMTVAELWAGVNTAKYASAATLKSLWGKGTDIVSAGTISIPSDGNYFHLTGVGGPITDIDFTIAGDGRDAWLYVESTPTLTNSANLVIEGAANYVCRAGDLLHVSQDNGDAVKVQVTRVDGTVMPAGVASTTDVLTGTNTLKVTSPDSIAALWELGTPVASAATVTLGEGGVFHITGNTGPITDIDFATPKDGRSAIIVFDSTPTLTHSATLVLPGSLPIVARANDRMGFHQDNGDTIIVDWYQRADGTALISLGQPTIITRTTTTTTAIGASKQNTSGYPLTLIVTRIAATGNSKTGAFDISANGATWDTIFTDQTSGAGVYSVQTGTSPFTVVIPPAGYYRCTGNLNADTVVVYTGS